MECNYKSILLLGADDRPTGEGLYCSRKVAFNSFNISIFRSMVLVQVEKVGSPGRSFEEGIFILMDIYFNSCQVVFMGGWIVFATGLYPSTAT